VVGKRERRIERSGVELLNRPRPTQGCRVDRRRTTVGDYAVAQLVEAFRYKPEGRGLDSRWSHWNFSAT
jgi:hypothetical protein